MQTWAGITDDFQRNGRLCGDAVRRGADRWSTKLRGHPHDVSP